MAEQGTVRRGRPYTESQLYKLPCHCCGAPARFQWNACADGNIWRPLCPGCDVRINIAVLRVLDPVRWKSKVRAYCKQIDFKLPKEWLK